MFPFIDTIWICASLVVVPADADSKVLTPKCCEGFLVRNGRVLDAYLPCVWLFDQGFKTKGQSYSFDENRSISRRESDDWWQYFDKESGLILHLQPCPERAR